MPSLPPDLPPKTPVCIGQLAVTALVLYPIPYLGSQEPRLDDTDWATVQLRYEHNPNKIGGSETIHIITPRVRAPNGEAIQGEAFGVVEQKVATALGTMLGKGLIRLDGKIRRGMPHVRSQSHMPLKETNCFANVASHPPSPNARIHTKRQHPSSRQLLTPMRSIP